MTKEEQIQTILEIGDKLIQQRRLNEAMAEFWKILELDNNNENALQAICMIFDKTGNPFGCEMAAKRLLKYYPENFFGYFFLSRCYHSMGKQKEAYEAAKKCYQMQPQNLFSVPSILYTSNTLKLPLDEIFKLHCDLAANYEPKPILQKHPFPKTKKIKVGFISSDFYAHSVAYFLNSLFENYNKERFEFHLFSNTDKNNFDQITEKLKQSTDFWHSIEELSDRDAAQLILNKQISVLFDLNGYTTAPIRMAIFGFQPAPVQISWLGYPNTTGMKSMDFRITDNFADSPDADKYYTEKLLRFKTPFICYSATSDACDIEPKFTEKSEDEPLIFGSFNNTIKITDETISLWCAVLKKVPNSQMFLKQSAFNDPKMYNLYLEKFAAHKIEKERLIMKGRSMHQKEHLLEYLNMDIALDAIPYNGTTTTCEAMFMGVPTIALMGESHVARVSAALNLQAGFAEFVAKTEQEFVEIAEFWAAHKKELCEYKNSMRTKMLASPLCNAKNFASEWERVINSILPA